MKFFTISILAALAAVCSAAPSIAAATLPASFTFHFVELNGTALQFLDDVVVCEHNGFHLYFTEPGNTPFGEVPVVFTGVGTSAASHLDFLTVANHGGASSVFICSTQDTQEGDYMNTGLSSLNGSLMWEFNGAGPQSNWFVCNDRDVWRLRWLPTFTDPDCYEVDLQIREG